MTSGSRVAEHPPRGPGLCAGSRLIGLVPCGNSESSMTDRAPRVVIIGAGFGGLTVAQSLRRAPVDLTVIDRHNFHYFQPLLYQVATAALSPADIAWPIRGILRRQKNTSVLMANVTGVDPNAKLVHAGATAI